MFLLTISFKQHGAGLQFVYKTEEKAKETYQFVKGAMPNIIEVYDDFGQYAMFSTADTLAMLMADNELGHKAAEEKAISLARAQAITNMRAKMDGQINNQLITAPSSLKMN